MYKWWLILSHLNTRNLLSGREEFEIKKIWTYRNLWQDKRECTFKIKWQSSMKRVYITHRRTWIKSSDKIKESSITMSTTYSGREAKVIIWSSVLSSSWESVVVSFPTKMMKYYTQLKKYTLQGSFLMKT